MMIPSVMWWPHMGAFRGQVPALQSMPWSREGFRERQAVSRLLGGGGLWRLPPALVQAARPCSQSAVGVSRVEGWGVF